MSTSLSWQLGELRNDNMENLMQKIEELRKSLEYHAYKYYVEDSPEISDYAYDRMFRELQELAPLPALEQHRNELYHLLNELGFMKINRPLRPDMACVEAPA